MRNYLIRKLIHAWLCATALMSSAAHAALHEIVAPSRGEGTNIIQTMQNYAFEGAALIGLLISAAAFFGVAYHAYCLLKCKVVRGLGASSGLPALLVPCSWF